MGRPSDRWSTSMNSQTDRGGIRPQHGSAPMGMGQGASIMGAPPSAGNSFLASAANIMMGVGLVGGNRAQEPRYDAYKNLSTGTDRRY